MLWRHFLPPGGGTRTQSLTASKAKETAWNKQEPASPSCRNGQGVTAFTPTHMLMSSPFSSALNNGTRLRTTLVLSTQMYHFWVTLIHALTHPWPTEEQQLQGDTSGTPLKPACVGWGQQQNSSCTRIFVKISATVLSIKLPEGTLTCRAFLTLPAEAHSTRRPPAPPPGLAITPHKHSPQ